MIRALALLTVSAATLHAQFPAAGTWKTDLSKKSIALSELRGGGPPKDGIPTINNPRFVSGREAVTWLHPKEPVLAVEHGGEARAYPLQILIFHELVNDTIGEVPILASYCPLCNSALTFDRRIDGETYDFGVTGMLRNSDMVMYDRQTDSLWQQLTGEGLVGTMTGKRLDIVSSQVIAFEQFTKSFPDGKVLSRNTGYQRHYGQSPYAGYEFSSRLMFPVPMKRTPPVRPMERVVAITLADKTRAYPFEYLRKRGAVEGKAKSQRYVVFYEPSTLTTMDARLIAAGRAIGSAGVFSPDVDGKRLKFRYKKGKITDKQTGSTWDVTGRAIDGPLAGQRLEPIESSVFYAFALYAFHPHTEMLGVAQQLPPSGLPGLGTGTQQTGGFGQTDGGRPNF